MHYRVQKIISMAGVCSRRKAEDLILSRRVTVNGKVVSLGAVADPETDAIVLDKRRVFLPAKKYYAFYKHRGYICSMTPHFGKQPVSVFFPKGERVVPVGRLDFLSEGLLLLTNDGDFANRVMHPRYAVEKEYRVVLDKQFFPISKDIVVDGKLIDARIIPKEKSVVHIILHEGQKHIVRNIFALLGYTVKRLIRIRIGSVLLGNLQPGKYRFLTKKEIQSFIKDFAGQNFTL